MNRMTFPVCSYNIVTFVSLWYGQYEADVLVQVRQIHFRMGMSLIWRVQEFWKQYNVGSDIWWGVWQGKVSGE